MRETRRVGYIVAAVCILAGLPTVAGAEEIMRCRLLDRGSETLKTADCMACHDGKAEAKWTGDPQHAPPTLHQTHPVDIDYFRSTMSKRGARLRDHTEAVRLGAFLPDGQIRCTTCHDSRSQYRFHLSIPTSGASMASFIERKGQGDPTPLCRICHKMGDD
jgi:hypothetical protein